MALSSEEPRLTEAVVARWQCMGLIVSKALSLNLNFRRAHSPTFSVTSPTSQLILQPFRCFIYVTNHSPTLLSLLLRHRHFTYVTWRAAHGSQMNYEPACGVFPVGVCMHTAKRDLNLASVEFFSYYELCLLFCIYSQSAIGLSKCSRLYDVYLLDPYVLV